MPGPPTLKINEVFSSIQGEGHWAGAAAVFVRFSGCNLSCHWCDTKYASEIKYRMSPRELFRKVLEHGPVHRVVLTGGEPTVQDELAMTRFVSLLVVKEIPVHVETNGTLFALWLKLAQWVTVSPKKGSPVSSAVVAAASELKLVYDEHTLSDLRVFESQYEGKELFLQPKSNLSEEICKCVQIVKNSPPWRLSIQLHKIIGIR